MAASAPELSASDTVPPVAPDIPTSSIEIPTTEHALTLFRQSYVRHTLGLIMTRFEIKPNKALPKLDEQKRAILTEFLYLLARFTDMTPFIAKHSGIPQILRCMMGDEVNGKQYLLPHPFPELFRSTWDHFEKEKWGATEEEDEDTPMVDAPASLSTLTSNLPQKVVNAPLHQVNAPARRRARSSHPIYGENGIMRGIIAYKGNKKVCSIDKLWRSRPSAFHGHNGLTVGQWWPRQLCAVRDGGHGTPVAGIAGTPALGVFSVVVSGKYATLDTDRGDRIWYSGSKAHENTNPDFPDLTADTRALQKALERRQQVRVLRGSKGEASFSPAVGIRYDGLYTVSDERTRRNDLGGAYLMFLLVRAPGQPAIQLDRPTAMEQRLFKRVTEGY